MARIVLTGAVGLSAGARSWALYNEVDVLFLSRRGTYLGQLSGRRSTIAAQRLLKKLPPEQLEECRPQLEQTVRLAAATKTALDLLQAQQANDAQNERRLQAQLQREFMTIEQQELEAKVSEQAMGAFVRNVAKRR